MVEKTATAAAIDIDIERLLMADENLLRPASKERRTGGSPNQRESNSISLLHILGSSRPKSKLVPAFRCA